ncbi:aminomethyl-transferring glycine dehydrogenase subunit GcvPA [Aquisalimonas sp.]|uniref:aminomethyl-transferring glycine dehydrogenase subunit GcvPA n=1 Tax=Aquisalimonas sp. TaxID=1872621 RepID=UPI0025BC8D43|nr:aminomethyl-transferring glycine dehydrogenase subunit GcvPA [Aquisalimonas sp.]
MPFIPHTDEDIRRMLAEVGVDSINSLFDEVPSDLIDPGLPGIPEGVSEMEITREMNERAAGDMLGPCFLGAGAYRHHVPAAVWEITTRGEYYSAYTPYQAEASQGTLQLIYEYQSMMSGLMGMDASNASLYDGGSALAEAVLMAVRANRKSKSGRILVPDTVNPMYCDATRTIVGNQGITLETVASNAETGAVDVETLEQWEGEDIAALVIQQPNWFGRLEEAQALTDWAQRNGALVIAVVNPTAMAVLTPPGEWGENGADIACGEGQPLGIPLSSGGPYFGFMCCRKAHVRQMPGRIVGRTVDLEGRTGYTLTLQAREQHIRRNKATSNICTNQGLMVTAATIYLSLLGAEGLERVAGHCHANTRKLTERLAGIKGVSLRFDGPYFHERVVELDRPAEPVFQQLASQGILAGYPLGRHDKRLSNALLVCATETVTDADIDRFADALSHALAKAA